MSDTPRESTGSLIGEALSHVSALVRSEIDLTRAELDQNARRAGTAIGLLIAALVMALTALNVLAGALTAALVTIGLAPGWAALIVGALFGLIAWGMLSKGLSDLSLSSLAPTRTAANIKRDARAVAGATDA